MFGKKENKCFACGKKVPKAESVRADHRRWHAECFRCSQCNDSLSLHSCRFVGGVVYCLSHAPIVACKNASNPYHTCTEFCRRVAEAETRPEARCWGCDGPTLEGEWIMMGERRWHRKCLCCAVCGVAVSQERANLVEGTIFCAAHAPRSVCRNASNPYHTCNDYCRQVQVAVGEEEVVVVAVTSMTYETLEAIREAAYLPPLLSAWVPSDVMEPKPPAKEEPWDCQFCGDPSSSIDSLSVGACRWHQRCFACVVCSVALSLKTYKLLDGMLFCKAHIPSAEPPRTICRNASNPYHTCTAYCREVMEGRRK